MRLDKKDKWILKPVKLGYIKRCRTIWKDKKDKRVTMATAHKRVMSGKEWIAERHHILSMVRARAIGCIVIYKGHIIDGNHTAISLIERKYKKYILVIERVK